MGMAAEVMAIGRFSDAIQRGLSGDVAMQDGVEVVESLFGATGIRGSSASRELAAALGVEAWNFNTHHFDPANVDMAALTALVGVDEVSRFDLFQLHGFEFFFVPNG